MSLAEKDRRTRHVKKGKNFKKTIKERCERKEAAKEVRDQVWLRCLKRGGCY